VQPALFFCDAMRGQQGLGAQPGHVLVAIRDPLIQITVISGVDSFGRDTDNKGCLSKAEVIRRKYAAGHEMVRQLRHCNCTFFENDLGATPPLARHGVV